jgi:serine/threonine protein kinase/lipoprotein NlpI
LIGKLISHYKVIEKLGSGGMGVVYKADDTRLKRTVALKFLPPELTRDKDAKKRFMHEAQAASALDHPNICTVYDIAETEDGHMYLAMAFYEGETLEERIGQTPLNLDDAVDIASQIARGLEKAHDTDIVHQDIKTANIFVTKDGLVKILDFGIAKLSGRTKLTKENTTLGTVSYMSPEQARGDDMDQRSDIWSLGVVFYEMITGQRPFKGDYDQSVMYAIMNENPEPVTGLRTGVPVELEKMILKCLEKDPSDRYQHINELLVDLRRLMKKGLKKESSSTIPPGEKKAKQRPLLLISAFIAIVVLLAVSSYYLFINKNPSPQIRQFMQWENSIAVLPFVDMSPDKDQEYFCDGMADDLITKLTRIHNLKVIARTSSFRYKNTGKSIREIAGELGVNTVLEGSIQKEENRIRVNAQLIHAEDAAHLWANTYDESIESVFEVQDRVTSAIAQALQLKLQPPAVKLAQRQTNIEAYDYYLKGMHFIKTKYTITLNKRDYETGLRMFQRAIEKDSTYALAYIGLSWAHYHNYVNTSDVNAYKLWEEDVKTAYNLDPGNPLTIASMGLFSLKNHRHEDAARFFKQALELNEDNADIQQSIGFSFCSYGLYQKALKYLRKSMELDPYYIWSRAQLAWALERLGRMEEAEKYLKQNIELAPSDRRHYLYYANYCIKMERFEEANTVLEQVKKIALPSRELTEDASLYKAYLLLRMGRFKKALELSFQYNAKVYSMLGRKKDAIDFLNGMMTGNISYYWDLLNNPYYDNLREDPHFHEIIKKEKKKHEGLLKIYREL